MLTAPPKYGKSTFCANFPNALFLATEPGLKALEAYEIPIKNWLDFLEACKAIKTGEHQFKTIVIDTVTNLSSMCADYVCENLGVRHASEKAHGAAWGQISSEFQRALVKLINLPYGIIFVSHVKTKEIDTRTGKKSKVISDIGGRSLQIAMGMCDLMLYGDFEYEKDGSESRVLRTRPSQNYDAGGRYANLLPDPCPFDYDVVMSYFKNYKQPTQTP